MRSLFTFRLPFKALAAVMLVAFALPVDAKPPRKKSAATKSKKAAKPAAAAPAAAGAAAGAGAAAAAAEPAAAEPAAAQAAPAPAPAPEKPVAEPPAAKPASSQAVAARPSSAAPPVARPAPSRAAPVAAAPAPMRMESTTPASKKLRIGVGVDLFTEDSRMSGEQAINTSRRDESFDYSGGNFLSLTLGMSVPAPIASERARIGGGVRLFGNYSAGGDRSFGFGLLSQAFVLGEYGLPVADKTEVMFGGRVGMSLLIPGRDFDQEIERLQVQGVGVLSVPRVGWLAGLSVGGRRRMSEHILLRADLSGQLDKLYLFSTSEEIEGLQFSKSWSTFGLRLGFTLGIEFAL
jgi:hypothetical protein